MAGDLLTGAANDDLMDITTYPDLLMAEGDGWTGTVKVESYPLT